MRKTTLLTLIIGLSTSLITSCTNAQTNTTITTEESVEHERKGPPPHGERRRGHHDGDRKGPPPGGGPTQSRTLAEIGGYNLGDVATDFSLKGIDGEMVSLEGYQDAKGYIVIFTCNECPFAKMYEDRLIALHEKYAPMGYPVIAINPNGVDGNDREGYEAMQKRAEEKNFPFAYLVDEGQEVYPQYGAVRTPHVFLLDKDRKVQYIGAIDDNARSEEEVSVKYVENAIKALENGITPEPQLTKAIGCPIKGSRG